MNQKTCSICKEQKHVSQFNKDKSRKDGFGNKCKTCYPAYQREVHARRKDSRRQYADENREKLRADSNRHYYWNKEKISQQRKLRLGSKKKSFLESLHESHVLLWKELFLTEIRKERRRYCARIAYSLNKDRYYAVKKEWKIKNKGKVKAIRQKYRQGNPDKVSFWYRTRRILMQNASVPWANEFFIEEAYDLARLRTKLTGLEWHVDHIVPINSELVCGLHVENNIQVIPYLENVMKSNRYWPDMP